LRRVSFGGADAALHEEITAEYTDMIYAATAQDIAQRRRAFLRKWRLRCPAVAASLEEADEKAAQLHASAGEPVEVGADDQCDRAPARGVQAPHQDADRAALGGDRGHAVLGGACQDSIGCADGMQVEGLLACGKITMRKVDRWQSLAKCQGVD
jgi:hypothetical protein